jgi:hypothetical protein
VFLKITLKQHNQIGLWHIYGFQIVQKTATQFIAAVFPDQEPIATERITLMIISVLKIIPAGKLNDTKT